MNKPVFVLKLSSEIVTVGELRREVVDGQITLVFIHLTRGDSLAYYASVVCQDNTVHELWTENNRRKQEPSIDDFVSFLTFQCGYRGDIVIRGSQSESLVEVKSSL